MTDVTLEPVAAGSPSVVVVERLNQLFRHDLSSYRDSWPQDDGLFPAHDVATYLGGDPDRTGWLFRVEGHVAGFALVRGVQRPPRILYAFFVVGRARRMGVGRAAAAAVLAKHPGPWQIAFQDNNPPAVGLWHQVAADAAGEAWRTEHRPVPDKPWIPPDTWISFDTTAPR
jgi:predicted acetyltransferase